MRPLHTSLPAVALALAAAPVLAVEIDLPGEEQRIEASYSCEGGRSLDVEFINIGDNHLAVIRIDGGDPLVFANVVAASGARYTARTYEFWDSGDEAMFTEVGSSSENCQPE